MRRTTPFKYKNVSYIRHHAPSFNAFRFPPNGTAKDYYFPLLYAQSQNLNTYLRMKYSLKCRPVLFILKAYNVNLFCIYDRRTTCFICKLWKGVEVHSLIDTMEKFCKVSFQFLAEYRKMLVAYLHEIHTGSVKAVFYNSKIP